MVCSGLGGVCLVSKPQIPSIFPPSGSLEEPRAQEEEGEEEGEAERVEEDPEVTKFYTNPIAKPIPQPLEGRQSRGSQALQDTIAELNVRPPAAGASNGLELSSEDASLADDSAQEEPETDGPGAQHPAGGCAA